MIRGTLTCTGPAAIAKPEIGVWTLNAAPPVIASTRFCNSINSPKVTKICIVGSFCKRCRTKRCTSRPKANSSGNTSRIARYGSTCSTL